MAYSKSIRAEYPDISLHEFSEEERISALKRFQIIRPFLEENVPLEQIARDINISTRTAWRWVARFREQGLSGLIRKTRKDSGKHKASIQYQEAIEALALQRPPPSIASIYRQSITIATKLKERPLSYSSIYAIVQKIDPALAMLAHKGSKTYSDNFDLVHRYTAAAPNEIWQADHTLLDIWLQNGQGKSERPWLTVILDDYSRAVAGYLLSFSSPSALQTSLALRQAIWRKAEPAWSICGIPQILYTDHGSDFTSRHIEQVAIDLKIRLVFSAIGKPRGRGKIERFFRSLSQTLLSELPGYTVSGDRNKAKLTLSELDALLEKHIVHNYHTSSHSSTDEKPLIRWQNRDFLPQLPESLEQLDLLLFSVPKTRLIRPDGIYFSGMRYIDPTLAAYIGEEVLLRYDPRDVSEVRVFYKNQFLCKAVCQELAGEKVLLRDIIQARKRRQRDLRQTLQKRRQTIDTLLEARRWTKESETSFLLPKDQKSEKPNKLKRYYSD